MEPSRSPWRHFLRCTPWLFALIAATTSGIATPASADEIARRSVKRLFAPAEDVVSGVVVLPAPERTPTSSRVAFLRATVEPSVDAPALGEARVELLHAGGPIRLLVLGRGAMSFQLALACNGMTLELDGRSSRLPELWKVDAREASQSALGLDEPARVLELELPAGMANLRMVTPAAWIGHEVVVAVDDHAPESMRVHRADRLVRAGSPCELAVHGADGLLEGLPSSRRVAVEGATVRWSDGVVEAGRIEALPDGGARVVFRHARAGDAAAWIDGVVQGADGVMRRRTVHYPIRVVAVAAVEGPARLVRSPSQPDWIDVMLPVVGIADRTVVFAAAEVWAVRARGRARCLGWIGGLAEVEPSDAGSGVRLGVEAARLALNAGEDIEMRAVRLHERDGFALIDLVAAMPVEFEGALAHAVTEAIAVDATAEHVRGTQPAQLGWHGPPGVASVDAVRSASFVPGVGSHALALTHGYCADANTWPPGHFGADSYYYLNPNQNFSHDAFALDLADRCDQFKSYGVVAHSQGGCAALHLYTFYWSGLDWAGPGRLVQTLGTPFEGTALAGNVAALGEIFGIQCGATYDMTYDGAGAWLSTIPSAARARVFTHTTTFTNVPFFYDYCNILADVLLTDPEDGVVEHSSGHIVGANDMGLRSGWCHVAGMRDPDQTLDASRNSVMNAQGAR